MKEKSIIILFFVLFVGHIRSQFLANIANWYLIDVTANGISQNLSNGSVVNLNSLNPGTIMVDTIPSPVGSVWFSFSNGTLFRQENAAPYTVNGNPNDQYAVWEPLRSGIWELVAVPYKNSANSPGAAGTASFINFTVVQESLSSGSFLGPSVLRTNSKGNSQLQMLKNPTTGPVQVTSLEILFSPGADLTGNYEIRSYVGVGNNFNLTAKQAFTIASNRIPSLININPPLNVLSGQFIAITNNAGALPLPTSVPNTNLGMYTVGVGIVPADLYTTMNANLVTSSPSWRALVRPFDPLATTSQPTTGYITTSNINSDQLNENLASQSPKTAGLSTAVKAGIGAGAAAGVCLIICAAGCIWFFVSVNKRSNRKYASPPMTVQPVPVQKPRTVRASLVQRKCERCDDKTSTVACKQCKKTFCHQCSVDLHYTENNKWASHQMSNIVGFSEFVRGLM